LSTQTEHNKDLDKDILSYIRAEATLEKGFRLLVQTYQERLYWHIRSMVKLHNDTDEVLQNTFIKVYKGIGKFRGDAKLYTWLYRIATNAALTYLKKKKRNRTVDIDNEESGVAHTMKADSYFDAEAAEQLLAEALDSLPEKQKEVFVMRYFDDLKYKEIAALTDTSVGGLKASYHHAVKKIESYLKSKM